MENEKNTTLMAITLGSKYFSYVRSPAPSHTQTLSNPFRNLTNKVRGKIFYKEVFLHLSVCFVYYCVFIMRLSLLLCRCDTVDDYITLRHQLKDVLFLFVFNVPLAETTSMLLVIILHEYKSLSHKLCSRCFSML